MAIKEILQVCQSKGSSNDDKFLKTITTSVKQVDDDILEVITDLRDTLHAYPFCIGLSAPQIGEPYAISILNFNHDNRDKDIILINPRVISLSGKKDKKRESCMSVWGYMGEVERREKVEIEYYDINLHIHIEKFEGFSARAIQHEIDHLNGIVYIDKLTSNSSLIKADFFDNFKILKN